MRKVVVTFGLIGGAILAVLMMATLPFHDQIGFDRAVYVGYTTMVVAFLMVYFGVQSYRDNVAGGGVTFGRAVAVGLLISLVIMVCYVVTWEIVYYNFMPDYLDKYAAHVIEQARQSGASDAAIAEQTRQMADFKEMFKNPLMFAAFGFLEPLPVALVFTLVTAGVLSRKRA
ncbi:MAG TPA: DUF4199 domain-containing protein [Vicinamibacterales bacterium]|nr:DUF4199 domain-containing protein [Vicinamibacterales bacterium]